MQAELVKEGKEVAFRENVGEKMSEVIEAFTEPYQQYANTPDEYHRLIGTAIIAWNAALAQGAKREQLLKDAAKVIVPKGDKQAREDFYAIVKEMIERKEKYFADNKRYIVNYRVTETAEGLHLSIASLME